MPESSDANSTGLNTKKTGITVALVVSIASFGVSLASAFFTYRNSEAPRENARLKAIESTANVEVFVQIIPGDKGPILAIRVRNSGAPVTVDGLGFEYSTSIGPRTYFLLQPADLKLPKRLERFDSITLTITPDIFRGNDRKPLDAKSLMVVTGAGEFRSKDEVNLRSFLSAIPTDK